VGAREQLEIDWQLERESPGNCSVLMFPSDPASAFEEAGLMYHQVIIQARERIWIASPYFVPDRGIIAALQLAALRGVDVRVMIPDRPDGPVVGMANWSFTRELLPAGVAVYRYEPAFMHQKVFLLDNELAGVGTANFDNRSFRLNFEITALVHDAGRSAPRWNRCCSRISSSIRSPPRSWRQAVLVPLATGAARLLAPVL
jgi:cardiolipin synthase